MPHDVTMPQLGMAQDSGRIVTWLKAPGDAVARGDALFEVETDKATMEVEAQVAGVLARITAAAGEDVPVGRVIARIAADADEAARDAAAADGDGAGDANKGAGDSAGDTAGGGTGGPSGAAAGGASGTAAGDTADDASGDDLPAGREVTMPQLGMAQDSGLLVAWHKAPGEAVATDDVLFEVETDKSTVEVAAGFDGYLAATLAEAGEDVPVGAPLAIISAEPPQAPVARSAASGKNTAPAPKAAPGQAAGQASGKASGEAPGQSTAAASAQAPKQATDQAAAAAPAEPGGRILASPKLRRIALEQGLDLARLVAAGHPQPYHMRDLETLKALPAAAPQQDESPGQSPGQARAEAARRLTARTAADGFAAFAAWAAEARGLEDADALLAGLAGASLGAPGPVRVAVERHGAARTFAVPAERALSKVTATDDPPELILRDLRGTAIRAVGMGPEEVPVLTLARRGKGLSVTLECGAARLDARGAIALLAGFSGRMEQPLRHLL